MAHTLLVTKDPLKIHLGVTLMPSISLSQMMHFKIYVPSSKRTSQWQDLSISSTKSAHFVSPTNNAQNSNQNKIAIDFSSPMTNGIKFPFCSQKINWMMPSSVYSLKCSIHTNNIWYLYMQVEERGKLMSPAKSFKSLLLGVKSVVACVQPVLVPVICDKDVHFTVCSRLGCQV